MIKALFTCLILTPICACAHWQGHLALEGGYDHLSGYSQIPRGGNFGTSSYKRPSFSEVNRQHDSFYRLEAGIDYRHYLLDLNYCHLNPHGRSILQQPLLTHAQFIPQNSDFQMETNFDWATLKLGKEFSFCHHNWQISPMLGGEWLRYRYAFQAPPKASVRAFSAFAPSFSLKLKHTGVKKLITEFEATTTFNLTNLNLYSAQVGLAYPLYQNTHFQILPQVKAGFLEIDFKDKQPFPNHVRYTGWPFATLGVLVNIR